MSKQETEVTVITCECGKQIVFGSKKSQLQEKAFHLGETSWLNVNFIAPYAQRNVGYRQIT